MEYFVTVVVHRLPVSGNIIFTFSPVWTLKAGDGSLSVINFIFLQMFPPDVPPEPAGACKFAAAVLADPGRPVLLVVVVPVSAQHQLALTSVLTFTAGKALVGHLL